MRNKTAKAWGQKTIISNLDSCRITPEGIEYLTDNSFMKKVSQYIENAVQSAETVLKLAPLVIDEVMKRM